MTTKGDSGSTASETLQSILLGAYVDRRTDRRDSLHGWRLGDGVIVVCTVGNENLTDVDRTLAFLRMWELLHGPFVLVTGQVTDNNSFHYQTSRATS